MHCCGLLCLFAFAIFQRHHHPDARSVSSAVEITYPVALARVDNQLAAAVHELHTTDDVDRVRPLRQRIDALLDLRLATTKLHRHVADQTKG